MTKTHLVFGDSHAHPDYSNDRADWLGELIHDVKPDVVIDLGDTADFPSLSTYDKGKRSFHGRSYEKDVEAHNEFQDRVWSRVRRARKRLPYRVRLIGNHEQRIDRCLDLHPELEGTISYKDLQLENYYDTIVPYDGGTPGIILLDGINYAHYFVSGVMGRAIGGEHPAHALLSKQFVSCTQGHTHIYDHCVRTKGDSKINGLITGCFQDYNSPWAGNVNKLWWRGCFVKYEVENGNYNLEQVSLSYLKRVYGS